MFGTTLSAEEKLIRELGRKLTKAERNGLLKAEATELQERLLVDARALSSVAGHSQLTNDLGRAADLIRRLCEEVRS